MMQASTRLSGTWGTLDRGTQQGRWAVRLRLSPVLLPNSRLALADDLSLGALVGRRGLRILTHLQGAPKAFAKRGTQ